MKHIRILLLFMLVPINMIWAEQNLNLQTCLNQALENNHNLKKSILDREKSVQAKKEIVGALLPQISASANLTDNIKKTKFIMPNFLKYFLPAEMLGGYTVDYLEIEMGMTYTSQVGVAMNQQVLNMSLFNAVKIAETAMEMAALGVESKEEDIITQTANLYYAIQVTEYAVTLFDKSLDLMGKMLETMETSYKNGIIKKVDLDRLKVTKINIETQKSSIMSAAEVQKNLLKLQMGLDMDQAISVEPISLSFFENKSVESNNYGFDINLQTPYKLLMKQKNMTDLQIKSAIYESLPVITFTMNYNYNFYNNEFSFKGDTYSKFPGSMAMLNLKVPVFGGFSRAAKLKQAKIEQKKVQEDAGMLQQSLSMAYLNTNLKLEESRKTINLQKENLKLAQDVFDVTQTNFQQGIASMSDVLNANSSLIQSQANYADALNNYMKSYIDLKKSNGTIRELVENK